MKTDVYNFWSVATGGIAIVVNLLTLLYVRWYALLTQTLVKTAQEQKESTQKELELLAAQVKAAQDSIEIQRNDSKQAARPFFVWQGVRKRRSQTGECHTVVFVNKGGPITILEIRSTNCKVALSPQNFIPRDGDGELQLSEIDPAITRYVGIKYRTEVGEAQMVTFVFDPLKDTPRISAKYGFASLMNPQEPVRPVDMIDETNVSQ